MFKITSNTLKNNQQIRKNSNLPTILSYIKDKGTEIPFAHKILTSDEYERYILYTKVKKGDCNWLKSYVEKNPLQPEEKTTIIKYINGLKEQPYSIPNLGISYISVWFGINSIYYSVTGVLIPILGNNAIINQENLQFLNNLTAGSVVLNFIGAYSIYYGLKISANELRSPYFHYDEMLRICQNNVRKNEN